MRKIATIAVAAAAVALMAFAPGAVAKSRHHSRCAMGARVDRNHDRIPDRWECRNHLSLRVNQARRDPDRDHLNNLGEFKAGTNPHDADTDNDGIEDGDEQRLGDDPTDADTDNNGVEDGNELSGKVESFDSGTGTLTIRRTDNSVVSGQVTDGTRIECETETEFENQNEQNDLARASSDGGGDHSGTSESGDDNTTNTTSGDGSGDNSGPGSTNEGPGSGDGNSGDDEARTCSTADLTPGTAVHEAEVENGTFSKVELVK